MKFVFSIPGSSLVALAIMSCTLPAFAQDEDEFVSNGGVLPAGMVQSLEPADRLAMNLRLLSQNPRDVNALMQAGISAVEVGDPNAAVGFLARAEALSPSNGRVKAALGSALVLLEKPVEALRFFNEAVAFGVAERDVMKDRGLAYDLTGDPKRAQRDYELALRSGPDPETTRRLALSLGANGEKDQALRLLDPLVRQNDQGAWRARAFVLAMTGDLRGAERIVEQVMPMGSLSPFLRRLPTLSVADRTRAVNFGTMPTDGRAYASAAPVGPARPISNAASTALATPVAPVVARFESSSDDRSRKGEKRRRPGKEQQIALATPKPAANPVAPPPTTGRARTPSPGFSTEPARPVSTPPPTEVASLPDRRIGKRIGDVDPARLPDVLKPGAPEPKWVAVAATSLPTPTEARPLVRAQTPTAASVAPSVSVTPSPVSTVVPKPFEMAALPKVETSFPAAVPTPRPESAPAPVFEVAAAKVTPTSVPISPPAAPAPQSVAAPLVLSPAKVAEVSPAPAQASVPTPAPIVAPPVRLVELPTAATPQPIVSPPPPQVAATLPSTPAAAPQTPALTPSAALATVTPAVFPSPAPQGTASPAKLPGPTSQEAGLIAPPATVPAESSSTILADLSPTTVTPLGDNQLVPATSVAEVATAPALETSKPEGIGLASVLEGITPEQESRAGPVLSDQEFRRARMVAKRKAEEEALAATGAKAKEEAEAKAKREEEEERKRVAAQNPARVWVQIATGANRSGLPITWKKIRDTAPDALKGAAAWYAPYKATNRLLVGPYKGQSEARALVGKLSAKGISTNIYSSDPGQEVIRLSSR